MILRGASTAVGGALTAGHRGRWLVAILALVCAPIVAALATWLRMQPIVLGLGIGGLLVVAGFRWPFVSLALFAALIPIEEVLVIEGIGTLSRVAGIVFAVTYAAPRLNNLSLGVMPPAGWAYVAFAMFSLIWAMDAPTASSIADTAPVVRHRAPGRRLCREATGDRQAPAMDIQPVRSGNGNGREPDLPRRGGGRCPK